MIYNGNGTTSGSLDDMKETVDNAVTYLRRHKDKFDFIAVRGCSGMLIGAPVALRLGKPLVVVRKATESSHSWGDAALLVNFKHANGRYIFLDDFIAAGVTEQAVVTALKSRPTEYVGRYLYADQTWGKKTAWFKPDAEVAA